MGVGSYHAQHSFFKYCKKKTSTHFLNGKTGIISGKMFKIIRNTIADIAFLSLSLSSAEPAAPAAGGGRGEEGPIQLVGR